MMKGTLEIKGALSGLVILDKLISHTSKLRVKIIDRLLIKTVISGAAQYKTSTNPDDLVRFPVMSDDIEK